MNKESEAKREEHNINDTKDLIDKPLCG